VEAQIMFKSKDLSTTMDDDYAMMQIAEKASNNYVKSHFESKAPVGKQGFRT